MINDIFARFETEYLARKGEALRNMFRTMTDEQADELLDELADSISLTHQMAMYTLMYYWNRGRSPAFLRLLGWYADGRHHELARWHLLSSLTGNIWPTAEDEARAIEILLGGLATESGNELSLVIHLIGKCGKAGAQIYRVLLSVAPHTDTAAEVFQSIQELELPVEQFASYVRLHVDSPHVEAREAAQTLLPKCEGKSVADSDPGS
ncbi:MAG: hypothetical protein K1X57_15170 [Gemmataceae bacterium]|nr:hypothetical protein [Gemmataceae bacterium]